MASPFGAFGSMRGALRLFVVGAAQRVEQFVERAEVADLGGLDGLLGKVVARNEARVGGSHCRVARSVRHTVGAQAFAPAGQPTLPVGGFRRPGFRPIAASRQRLERY